MVADAHGGDSPSMTKCDGDELRFGKRYAQSALVSLFSSAPVHQPLNPASPVFLGAARCQANLCLYMYH